MNRYVGAELAAVLEAADSKLSAPAEVVLVGGAALLLAYGGHRASADIDFVSAAPAARAALEEAGRNLGVPVQDVAAAGRIAGGSCPPEPAD